MVYASMLSIFIALILANASLNFTLDSMRVLVWLILKVVPCVFFWSDPNTLTASILRWYRERSSLIKPSWMTSSVTLARLNSFVSVFWGVWAFSSGILQIVSILRLFSHIRILKGKWIWRQLQMPEALRPKFVYRLIYVFDKLCLDFLFYGAKLSRNVLDSQTNYSI